MKNRFDLIIFDWDGTLIDSVHWITECLQQAARDCDLPIPTARFARSVIGLSLDRAMDTLFPVATQADMPSLIAAYRRYYNVRLLGRDDLFAGVSELLNALRDAGFKLAVATGKTRNGLDQALANTGYAGWFHATRAANETASKPNPLMLLQLMEELNASPGRTLMVGDSVHDLEMARNANIDAVGVGSGANDRDELLAFNPLLVLGNMVDLREFLL
ncbi:MAG: HAD-IA family hydrolase [Candidatus Methylumidiphilus sp.]